MNVFDDRRAELAGKLAAAGLPSTLDPGALPPFALVDLVTTTAAAGIGGWSASIPVKLAVPPPGDATAAAALGDMLEAAYGALGFAPAVPQTISAGGKDVPGYVLTYPTEIPNPNC